MILIDNTQTSQVSPEAAEQLRQAQEAALVIYRTQKAGQFEHHSRAIGLIMILLDNTPQPTPNNNEGATP